jgi:hypothetical protein
MSSSLVNAVPQRLTELSIARVSLPVEIGVAEHLLDQLGAGDGDHGQSPTRRPGHDPGELTDLAVRPAMVPR